VSELEVADKSQMISLVVEFPKAVPLVKRSYRTGWWTGSRPISPSPRPRERMVLLMLW